MTVSIPDMSLTFQVKGYDIDVAGIVHNSVYLLWLDDIRTAFLEKVQSIEEQVRLGYVPVLSKTEISYKRAVKFGDRPVAHMHVTLIARARWRISCEFLVNGVVTTSAVQEGCLVDMNTGRPIQMPAPFLRYWELKQRNSPSSGGAIAGERAVEIGEFEALESIDCRVHPV